MQEELKDDRPLPSQVFLELSNVAKPFGPNLLAHARLGELLAIEDVRMHADDKHLLVIGAVKDSDSTAFRKALRVAPQEIVAELLARRLLEGEHLDALRI